MNSNINSMIDRGNLILDYIYSSDYSVGVSEISKALDIPKATVFRILTTYEKSGILYKDVDEGKYSLGLTILKYASKITSDISLVNITKDMLDNFSSEKEENINLAINYNELSLNIYTATHGRTLLSSTLIPISPLNCSASGKIFLSTKSKKELDSFFKSNHIEKRTVNSITDMETYIESRNEFYNTGYMIDDEEYAYGLYCISVPIYYSGKIIASISITGPKTRLKLKGVNNLSVSITKLAKEIEIKIKSFNLSRLINI